MFMLTDGRVVGWRLFDCDGPVDFLSEVGAALANIQIYRHDCIVYC